MNKYEDCVNDINELFLSKGFKPIRDVAGNKDVFCLPGSEKDMIFFYVSTFFGNKNFTKEYLNSDDAIIKIYEVIKPFLKKWRIEDVNFYFTNLIGFPGRNDTSIFKFKEKGILK